MEDDPLGDFIKRGLWGADAVKNHPLGDLRTEYPHQEVRAMQTSMTDWASHFSQLDLDHIRCITRLTVEFFYFLRRWDIDSVGHQHIIYMDESTFAGMESFLSVCAAYRSTLGETRSELPQRVESRALLKEQYIAMYRNFVNEANGEKKCRQLLDLYKLQIVFAGLTYD